MTEYREPPQPSPHAVTAFGRFVVKLEIATGKEVWRVQLSEDGAAQPVRLHLAGDEIVALASTELRLMRLGDGSTIRRVELTHGHSTLLVLGRRALVSANGEISCIDLDRGTVLWRNELPGTGYGAAAIAVPGAGTVQGDATG